MRITPNQLLRPCMNCMPLKVSLLCFAQALGMKADQKSHGGSGIGFRIKQFIPHAFFYTDAMELFFQTRTGTQPI